MINLQELIKTSSEELPEIYCDLDQVLVDLMKGADEVVGGSFITHDKDERWKLINQKKGFWADLTVMDIDPFKLATTSPGELLNGKIMMTVVNGKIVYQMSK